MAAADSAAAALAHAGHEQGGDSVGALLLPGHQQVSPILALPSVEDVLGQ